ncbi:branched-chain amino acid ABC transporter permease [Rhodopseudomonas palustris]|uniref:Branched-chain amino acid ABC transporter permease n=1 Tax=Rhodopseudomonas palustris TaxID=1076 RepID=A0A418V0M3_RHOPL|nr:branched-chain amino acid ABC transporter permease [Rhodopseudomonas palustris]RJF69363.1 branched-chain amino acid ABC transporter permease [Rhodopseudomonas palustris]
MKKYHYLIMAIVAALVLAMPLLGNNYLLRMATSAMMYATLTMAWNFVGGFAGYPLFGIAAFFGLGAYSAGVIQSSGIPAPIAWCFAVVIGAAFAYALGHVLLRLRGHAFAIATLVIAEVLRELTNGWTWLTGGGMGLNLPFFGWSPAALATFFFYAMFILVAATFATTYVIAHNRLGFALNCIRQNEDAANIVGVDTTRYKIIAFTLAGAYAAAAGGIYASWTGYIEPSDVYDVLFSIKPILMALLGGMGTVFGPIIGAVAFLVLDEIVWRNFLQLHTGVLGLLIVVLILFLPAGLSSIGVPSFRRKVATP